MRKIAQIFVAFSEKLNFRVATESGTFLKLKLCQNKKGQTFFGMLGSFQHAAD